ncbi:MAG: hypothetical protein AB4290_24760 [Spirulina sp.]
MNVKAFLLASIIGLSAPAIANIAIAPSAVAQPAPLGTFGNSEWTVTISYYNNSYYYVGANKQTGDWLELSGAAISGNSNRSIYTWNNSGYRYQVSWQPADRNVIRLQVYTPNGQQVLNQLLYRTDG